LNIGSSPAFALSTATAMTVLLAELSVPGSLSAR